MRRAVATVAVVTMLSGCSFLMVRPSPRPIPPEYAPDGKPGWTECGGSGVPALDFVGGLALAAGFALAGFGEALNRTDAFDNPSSNPSPVSYYDMAGGTLALFTASALYGAIALDVCNDRLDSK